MNISRKYTVKYQNPILLFCDNRIYQLNTQVCIKSNQMKSAISNAPFWFDFHTKNKINNLIVINLNDFSFRFAILFQKVKKGLIWNPEKK